MDKTPLLIIYLLQIIVLAAEVAFTFLELKKQKSWMAPITMSLNVIAFALILIQIAFIQQYNTFVVFNLLLQFILLPLNWKTIKSYEK